MAVIGDEIRDYVATQINVRQAIHGLGAGQALDNVRSDVVINVLNSNTSWVKLASGVSVAASKLTEIGVDTALAGLGLAKRYVLNAGFSKYEETKLGGRLTQREGFLPQETNSSYTYGTYGYSPMPGIISADIKALNRGSIKKATVKIKINNKEQFNIIDLLYFRLGYTVLLEWGNSLYFDNTVKKDNVRETIIDNELCFFNSTFGGSESYREILPKIEGYRRKYAGNYDGLLGKISNFQWSFNKDGSYDAEITIISLGDVVESLKTNISTDKTLANFILQVNGGASAATNPSTTESTEGEQPDVLEDSKDANSIASMLWAWKWVNKTSIGEFIDASSISNTLSNGTSPIVGKFLNPSGDTLTATTRQFRFYYYYGVAIGTDQQFTEEIDYNALDRGAQFKKDYPLPGNNGIVQFTSDQFDPTTFKSAYTSNTFDWFPSENAADDEVKRLENLMDQNGTRTFKWDSGWEEKVSVGYEEIRGSAGIVTTESPIKGFGAKDAFWLNSGPKFPLYLRLGALLSYVGNSIIPKIDTSEKTYSLKPPVFKIDSGTFNNIMYSLPNQISLDPRVCIVSNRNFNAANETGATPEKYFFQLYTFRLADSPDAAIQHPNKAYMMNIYLNFEFILECLNSAADERGDTNTFSFLQNICNGLNKALGGINNIEPVMNEETNTLRLQDTTPIPGNNTSPSYILQLYGYDKLGKGYASNFVRKVDLKTAITPEYATMITIGATAGGYVKGTEATAFSRWNEGLTDRFKEKFTPGNENSIPDASGVDEAVINYVEKMLAPPKYPARLGFLITTEGGGNGFGDISSDAIENNLSVGTEYFKYLIASQKNQQGGTVGFIPFKIGFTMDGLSGIKIYNKLHVDTRFLPKAYGNTLDLIVTGVSHKLQKSDWETDIEATVMPKTNELKDLVITAAVNVGIIQQGVTASGGKGGKTSYPELPYLDPPPPSNLLSYKDAAIKLNKLTDKSTAKAVFAIMWAEASKNSKKESFRSAGGYNYSGVQTDSGRWGAGGIIARYRRIDVGGNNREFAVFKDDDAFLSFMISRIKAKGFNGNNGDSWTTTYINSWWSPKAKKSYTKGTDKYNAKLAIYNTAIRKFNVYIA
jgi:hypothetical protein